MTPHPLPADPGSRVGASDPSPGWAIEGAAVGIAALALAVGLAGGVDHAVAHWVYGLPESARRTADLLTHAGDSNAWIPASFGMAALSWRCRWHRLARAVLVLGLAVVLSGLLVNAIKPVAGRLRPGRLVTTGEHGFRPLSRGYHRASFPSGHASTMGVAGALLAVSWPRLAGPWIAMSGLIACTRVFTLSHFPSDVVVGYCLGLVVAGRVRRWVGGRVVDSSLATVPERAGAS